MALTPAGEHAAAGPRQEEQCLELDAGLWLWVVLCQLDHGIEPYPNALCQLTADSISSPASVTSPTT